MDGFPARRKTGKRFGWSMKTTYDPTEEVMEFPYRTVFYGPCDGDEIVWSEIEMFLCAEEWQGFDVMEFEKVEDVVITIMEAAPQEVSRYIHERIKESRKKPQEEASCSSEDKKNKMEVDVQEKLESRLPTIGEDEFEEKMIVGGVELTPESSLKELKQACKFLRVGVTGSKQLLWQRLKKEVAENKLATASKSSFGKGLVAQKVRPSLRTHFGVQAPQALKQDGATEQPMPKVQPKKTAPASQAGNSLHAKCSLFGMPQKNPEAKRPLAQPDAAEFLQRMSHVVRAEILGRWRLRGAAQVEPGLERPGPPGP